MTRPRRACLLVLFLLAALLPALAAPAPKEERRRFPVEAFGARGDGLTLCTAALQAAIDSAAAAGGGMVVIPRGRFLSGTIQLKSGVTLHIERGGTLLGSADPFLYRKIDLHYALILADHAAGIAITGAGTIDGQGQALALNADSLHHCGARVDPNYNQRRKRPSESMRPQLIHFTGCSDVLVRDITLRNSSCWVQTYSLCRNLRLEHLRVISRAFWNNDGIDIDDCRNVRITGCDVNSADDGICLKSHRTGACNDSIYIADCTVRSSASAVKFGTASTGGFRNITVENIRVIDTYRSAIAIETVDGGRIENIIVRHIRARNTGNAFFLRLGQRSGDSTGFLRNVRISDMEVQVPFDAPDRGYDLPGPPTSFFHNSFPAVIAGLPGRAIENLVLEDIQITAPGHANKGLACLPLSRLEAVPEEAGEYPEFSMFGELPAWGLYARHVTGLTMNNLTLKAAGPDFRPALLCDDGREIRGSALMLDAAGAVWPMVLHNVAGAAFTGLKIRGGASAPLLQSGRCSGITLE